MSCFCLLLLLGLSGTWACNPYACGTDARDASYGGRLGQTVAPSERLTEQDSGRIFVLLNEWRGSTSQQNVIASVRVRGFVSAVSEIHVHQGTPAAPGRVLWKSTVGYLAGDSVWNTYLDLFAGPASWSDFWTALDEGRAYFELHAPSGESVSGGLRQLGASPFRPSCT